MTALLAWLTLTAALLLSGIRGPTLAAAWRLVFALTLAVQLASAARWLLARRRLPAPRRATATPSETVALLMVASSAAELAGTWLRAGGVVGGWGLEQVNGAVTWGAVACVQLYFLASLKTARR